MFFFSKSEANIRVVRIKLDNGERVVGVRYPEVLVRQVEKVLTDQKQSQTVSIIEKKGGGDIMYSKDLIRQVEKGSRKRNNSYWRKREKGGI